MKTLVLGDYTYARPFQNVSKTVAYRDYTKSIVDDLKMVDLVVFTGGPDVDPRMYGESALPTTISDYNRDIREESVYAIAKKKNLPMVGICRGAQFLNVMNNGSMYQHVIGHNKVYNQGHHILDLRTNTAVINVSSAHHQVCRLGDDAETIAVASELDGDIEEVEAFWYGKSKCLGVQFHPEWASLTSREGQYFQTLLEEYIL